jgi:hypothetical protein
MVVEACRYVDASLAAKCSPSWDSSWLVVSRRWRYVVREGKTESDVGKDRVESAFIVKRETYKSGIIESHSQTTKQGGLEPLLSGMSDNDDDAFKLLVAVPHTMG